MRPDDRHIPQLQASTVRHPSLREGEGARDGGGARAQAGISLIELMLSMSLFVTAMAMAFGGYAGLMGVFRNGESVADRQLDLTETFLVLEEYVRNAGADPEGAGLFSGTTEMLEVLTPDAFQEGGLRVRADLTGEDGEADGDIDDAGEVATFVLVSGTLFLRLSDGEGGVVSRPLMKSVTSFLVEPLDDAGVAAPAENASQLRISLACESPSGLGESTMVERRYSFNIGLWNRQLGSG